MNQDDQNRKQILRNLLLQEIAVMDSTPNEGDQG